jgi:hypothetical protein
VGPRQFSGAHNSFSGKLTELKLKIQDILCTVNVQHNCAGHNCGTANTRHIYQERERTDQTRPVVSHIVPQDIILNTAQMRDAIHVQRYRQHSEVLDADRIITESAAREVFAQKALQKSSETTLTPKAAAVPRNISRPQRVAVLQDTS